MSAHDPFRLDLFLPYRLSVAATRISRRFAERYAAEAGLSIPEWRVMAHLNHSGSVSVRDIHARVNLDKSMVSRAATRLEQVGLVSKAGHDQDRRLVALELTAKGRELMQRLGRSAQAFQAELVAELGEDAEALDRALARLGARPD
ncbi:MarR family winged helix-turn-helix transcriptional regulator [Paracoccus spongiarum]|uniref:MarR family winged helix-turn-helix transcriptional regulator n=1 Tax=Paracoccus spongiarum TaxID=3064387 RepID=A0ABT9JA09_9RHOB|nr:MarR family winged helix-turn-helix transcriptional regulator [Paracoccus sp. 2205BS29-5]MDP5306652.1 MarR family winged helix-turn-helix transcriptional regulator [Paracoccus sp. 2205BS29-5]